jgi:predicted P-loop ATPase
MRLTEADFEHLEKSYITREIAIAAGIYRVTSIDGRELVGKKGGGDYSGIIFPCRWPGDPHAGILAYRLRTDHPPIDLRTGKPQHKYMTAAGTRNRFYWPLAEPDQIADTKVPVHISEGEKKGLALHRVARESNGNGRPDFLAMSLFGVWSWKGTIGIATDENGLRTSQKGVIPDFDRVPWEGRIVYLVFDTNVLTNESVAAARRELAKELESRGAIVYFVNIPESEGVNGVDDYLARAGPRAYLDLVAQHALRYDWREELYRNEKGKVQGTFANALTAFRLAPEWHGVLAYNEFGRRPEALKAPPWADGRAGPWGDQEDRKATEWLERHGIRMPITQAGQAALTVAIEHPFHPVRQYLDGLVWDGVPRLDHFAHRYLGVRLDPDDQTYKARTSFPRAACPCWFISGVARIYEPGCKVDHALVFKGPQGGFKSTTFATLGGPFYSDDIADLGTKDASLGAGGAWIIELPELAAMARPEIEKTKSFLSRSNDRFRPPYGKHNIEVPRQCIFGGSVNTDHFLRDDTGNRRFWPIECGEIDIEGVRRDRDQLWAEAVVRYRNGEKWYLKTAELVATAQSEQEEAYQPDPWEPVVEKYLSDLIALKGLAAAECTIHDILRLCLFKDTEKWSRADATRVGVILTRLGWESTRPWVAGGGPRPRIYRPKAAAKGRPNE